MLGYLASCVNCNRHEAVTPPTEKIFSEKCPATRRHCSGPSNGSHPGSPKKRSRIMNNPEHLTYSIDKNKLRIGAALGVIVITAGFALGSVMHTSSSSANEPAAPITDDTATTGNESDQTTNNTSSISNDQPVADKESIANETNQTQVEETDETDAEETEVEETADETEAEAEADEADTDESDEAEAEEVEETADETEAEEAEVDESDEAENDDDGNNDGNSNGFGWDFGLVLPDNPPENLIDPLPLPDDLGPIGPIGPGI